MNERDIVALYNERNEEAIEITDIVYGEQLLRFAKRFLDSPEEAQECVNDTYLKLWNAIPPAQPRSFSAYAFQICRFEVYGKIDKQRAAKRSAQVVELTDELQTVFPYTTVEEAVDAQELERHLQAFLASLSKDKRMMFMRRYWFGDSVVSIANRYHISESKVKTSLHRARRKLQQYLEKEGLL